jgi:ABC-2 type transport system permease protein
MREINAILTIAFRDFLKFMRDRGRIVSTFVFPFTFIFILGGSMEGIGRASGYNYLPYVFTGVLAQTLFQSSALGIISLIDDRENDFSQEIFVSPISRYSIIFGKILGEGLVSMVQGLGIVAFALIIGIPMSVAQLLGLIPVSIVICLFGGAFGVMVLANLKNRRTADQIFPFIMFPQFFLAYVFTPVLAQNSSPVIETLSRIVPLRYAVDWTRSIFYSGTQEYANVVLTGPTYNLVLMTILFAVFMIVGTGLFVRNERNR